jgi:hypothetical protein
MCAEKMDNFPFPKEPCSKAISCQLLDKERLFACTVAKETLTSDTRNTSVVLANKRRSPLDVRYMFNNIPCTRAAKLVEHKEKHVKENLACWPYTHEKGGTKLCQGNLALNSDWLISTIVRHMAGMSHRSFGHVCQTYAWKLACCQRKIENTENYKIFNYPYVISDQRGQILCMV